MRVWRHGQLIEDWAGPNLVVASSRFMLAQLIGGAVASNSVSKIGFGSSGVTPAIGNTGLSPDAYFKALDSITYPTESQVAFNFSLGTSEANGQSIAEYGLLSAANSLFSRVTRSAPLMKDISVTLNASWIVSF